ncbi:ubiquitin carboxyl-terminal hydrolase CYLD isoform X2 [Bemisia tabaci]
MAYDSLRGRRSYASTLFVVNRSVLVQKLSGSSPEDQIALLLGSIVKSEDFLGSDYTSIKVLDPVDISSTDSWKCSVDALTPITGAVFPYIIAIPSPEDRVRIASDPKLCAKVAGLQINDVVEFFLPDGLSPHLAVVQKPKVTSTIGPGLYLEIQFLDPDSEPNLDREDLFFRKSENGILVTVDRIRPVSVLSNTKPQGDVPSSSYNSLPVVNSLKRRSGIMSSKSNALYSQYGSSRKSGPLVNLRQGENVIWMKDGKQPIDCSVQYFIPNAESASKVQLKVKGALDTSKEKGFVTVPISEVYKKGDPIMLDKNGKDAMDGEDLRLSRSNRISLNEVNSKQQKFESPALRHSFPNSKDFEHSMLDSDLYFLDSTNVSTVHAKQAKISSLLDNSNKHSTVAYNNNCQPHFPSAILDDDSSDENGSCGCYDNVADLSDFDAANSEFSVGSLVVVDVKDRHHYGVIRWIGPVGPIKGRHITFAGIEMEEEDDEWSDGKMGDIRYFQCPPNRGFFCPLSECQKDTRFLDDVPRFSSSSDIIRSREFGLPVIPGIVKPINKESDIESVCGKNKGIQGHHNSCYLDATLFAMFTFTSVFDSLLFRPRTIADIPEYEEVQRVLKEEVVNPLRENLYVRADRVMKLRTLLDKLSSVSGLTSEEKDPEEFLNSLLAQILKAEPFLKLSSGQEAYYYQLFVEKDEQLKLPTVQQLFEQSFLTSDIKLKEVPSCLIIQMPRFGKSYKMYPRILPSQLLDVTDVIENSPRQCSVCGKLAEYECSKCFRLCEEGLQCTAFCTKCCETAHNHEKRRDHTYRKLNIPSDLCNLPDHFPIPRLYMELFAVVCIETSHYVAFVKAGCGSDAPWCFFDSMADRKGEQNGYNIPEMVSCPDLPYWLSDKGSEVLNHFKDERHLPEPAKRLLCDAYMCMYQSREVMMYR